MKNEKIISYEYIRKIKQTPMSICNTSPEMTNFTWWRANTNIKLLLGNILSSKLQIVQKAKLYFKYEHVLCVVNI